MIIKQFICNGDWVRQFIKHLVCETKSENITNALIVKGIESRGDYRIVKGINAKDDTSPLVFLVQLTKLLIY